MARLSINELTTYRWSFEEDVTNYAAAGIPAIGVWREKLTDFGEEKALELLRESGLSVSHLLWAGGFTGADGRPFRDSVDDGIEAIRQAGLLRCPTLVVYTGPRGGHTHNHARRLIRQAFEQLIPHAEEHGVTLAVEPMHPAVAPDWTMVAGLDEAIAWLDLLGSSQIGIVFDTFHLGFDEGVTAKLSAIADRIALVQLGDTRAVPDGEPNRCRLGEGVLPLGELVTALQQAGYTGDYDVELLGDDLCDVDYHELIAHSQEAFHRLVRPSAVA